MIVDEDAWLRWYNCLDEVARRALNRYNETGDERLIPFFWHKIPGNESRLLPLDIELIWHMWYGSLSSIQRVAIRGYFVGDSRVLLVLWDSLLNQVQQPTEVSMP